MGCLSLPLCFWRKVLLAELFQPTADIVGINAEDVTDIEK